MPFSETRVCNLVEIRFFQMREIQSPEIAAEQKKELKVLLQASLICSMLVFTLVGFFALPQLFESRWINFVANLIWLICAGNNAVIYLTLNRWLQFNEDFKF